MSASSAATKLISQFDSRRANELCCEVLAEAGITVGGSEPWDIQVKDERMYQRILRDGSLGFGETYMEGWWDSPALDQTIDRVCRARIRDHVKENWVLLAHAVKSRLLNRQTPTRSFEVAHKHY